MIPTALTEKETEKLVELAAGKTVLEVGSLLGYSTVAMAKVAKVVHSVDPHEGYPQHNPQPTLRRFIDNLKEHGVYKKTTVHVGYGHEVLPFLQTGTFDLAFLDLDGTYITTRTVMEMVIPLLKHYSTLIVHDYHIPKWPGVERAVLDFRDQRRTLFEVVDTMAIFEQTWNKMPGATPLTEEKGLHWLNAGWWRQ